MFRARIEGTLTATAKHATLQACRFLIGQRLEPTMALARRPSGGPPVVSLVERPSARTRIGGECPQLE